MYISKVDGSQSELQIIIDNFIKRIMREFTSSNSHRDEHITSTLSSGRKVPKQMHQRRLPLFPLKMNGGKWALTVTPSTEVFFSFSHLHTLTQTIKASNHRNHHHYHQLFPFSLFLIILDVMLFISHTKCKTWNYT